jgi:phosphopantetheinyl transferase
MSVHRDVPPEGAGVASPLALWLAGPAALPLFEVQAQTPEDLERWRRIVSPRRRAEWEVSRALLAHVRRRLGIPGAAVGPGSGVPAAPRQPDSTQQASPGLQLSLSHSGGYAAVAASTEALRLGVDLECERRGRDVERLARFGFSEAEQAQLAALPFEARPERFYVLWTLKEAFAKALSLELFASLSRCTFLEEHGEWRGVVPATGEWVAQVFKPAAALVLSIVALLPHGMSTDRCGVCTSEWPEPQAQSWRSLAMLHSRSA